MAPFSWKADLCRDFELKLEPRWSRADLPRKRELAEVRVKQGHQRKESETHFSTVQSGTAHKAWEHSAVWRAASDRSLTWACNSTLRRQGNRPALFNRSEWESDANICLGTAPPAKPAGGNYLAEHFVLDAEPKVHLKKTKRKPGGAVTRTIQS